MYGSRAANGVILIETKKAAAGVTNVGFSAYYGIQTLSENDYPDMMNGQEFAQFKKEIAESRGLPVPEAYQNPSEYGEGTDWFGLVIRDAPMQNYR